MKKAFFYLLAFLFVFASCEGPVGPVGPEGPAGPGTNWKILTFNVKSQDWKIMENDDHSEPRFYCEFNDVAEIDDFIYTDGLVTGYLYTNMGIETQTPLPYVYHREGRDAQTGLPIYWTETYSFDYAPGSIAFYVTYSDFFVDQQPPTMDFRVALMW